MRSAPADFQIERSEKAQPMSILKLDGVDLYYELHGEGPAVVFIHGASNGGSSWASLVARLDGFRCIMLDRPGCGLSDPLPTRPDGIAGGVGWLMARVYDPTASRFCLSSIAQVRRLLMEAHSRRECENTSALAHMITNYRLSDELHHFEII